MIAPIPKNVADMYELAVISSHVFSFVAEKHPAPASVDFVRLCDEGVGGERCVMWLDRQK